MTDKLRELLKKHLASGQLDRRQAAAISFMAFPVDLSRGFFQGGGGRGDGRADESRSAGSSIRPSGESDDLLFTGYKWEGETRAAITKTCRT